MELTQLQTSEILSNYTRSSEFFLLPLILFNYQLLDVFFWWRWFCDGLGTLSYPLTRGS